MSGADETPDPSEPAGAPARRRRRVPYFERPKQPHDWRWVVGGIGKTLITLGLLMFAFVGYQLWGTGIQTARAQNSLENEFEQLMAATTTAPATTTTTIAPSDSVPVTESTLATTTTVPVAPSGPPTENGAVIARLLIPRLDLDWYVVQGVGKDDLTKGPGHFRETPLPGQLGNAAIAGHRTTHGAPFGDLDEMEPGDLITVVMANGSGTFTYSVTNTLIVEPSEYGKVIPTIDSSVATLTLATCHPEYTSKQRLVVQALLVPEQSDQVMAPPADTLPPEPELTLPDEEPDTSATSDGTLTSDGTVTSDGSTTSDGSEPASSEPQQDAEPADGADAVPLDDGFSGGWFDDSAAIPHAIAWGLALLAVGVGAYFAGKASNRLYVSFIVGFVPFVVVLYFFFENVNRLLPPGL